MHYSLAVITEEKPNDEVMKKILAPYDQGLQVEPYVVHSYQEVKAIWTDDAECLDGDDKAELLEALEKDDISIIRYINAKHGEIAYFEDINKNGEGISTHNPNSQWDSWHVLDVNTSFLGIRQLAQLKYIPRPSETDSEIETAQKFPDMNKHYRDQLIFDKEYRPGWADDHYPTLYDYICYRLPLDIVYPDGTWHEYKRGNIKENREYCKEFYRILDSFPHDSWLTLVDCHI